MAILSNNLQFIEWAFSKNDPFGLVNDRHDIIKIQMLFSLYGKAKV